jgi:hypothetical protein
MQFKETKAGVTFHVRVTPRAGRNEVVGVEGDALKVRLTAPPVGGAANDALVDLLAEVLHLRKSQVSLIGGLASRHKTVAAQDRSVTEIRKILMELAAGHEGQAKG